MLQVIHHADGRGVHYAELLIMRAQAALIVDSLLILCLPVMSTTSLRHHPAKIIHNHVPFMRLARGVGGEQDHLLPLIHVLQAPGPANKIVA